MQTDQTELLNFRIPKNVKMKLKDSCSKRHVTITSVLNELIHEYLAESEKKQLQEDWVPMIYNHDEDTW